jgi:hypothetical protein
MAWVLHSFVIYCCGNTGSIFVNLSLAFAYSNGTASPSDGQVWFSLVLRHYLLNPELDPQFDSGDLPEPQTEPPVLVLFSLVPVQEEVECQTEHR